MFRLGYRRSLGAPKAPSDASWSAVLEVTFGASAFGTALHMLHLTASDGLINVHTEHDHSDKEVSGLADSFEASSVAFFFFFFFFFFFLRSDCCRRSAHASYFRKQHRFFLFPCVASLQVSPPSWKGTPFPSLLAQLRLLLPFSQSARHACAFLLLHFLSRDEHHLQLPGERVSHL